MLQIILYLIGFYLWVIYTVYSIYFCHRSLWRAYIWIIWNLHFSLRSDRKESIINLRNLLTIDSVRRWSNHLTIQRNCLISFDFDRLSKKKRNFFFFANHIIQFELQKNVSLHLSIETISCSDFDIWRNR